MKKISENTWEEENRCGAKRKKNSPEAGSLLSCPGSQDLPNNFAHPLKLYFKARQPLAKAPLEVL